LFGRHKQLIVYHFMFEPDRDEGCPSCSYLADNFTGAILHLPARDTAFAVVSRAPLAKLTAFKQRMGWTFPWYSSYRSDSNADFGVTVDASAPDSTYNYRSTARSARTLRPARRQPARDRPAGRSDHSSSAPVRVRCYAK